MQTTRVGSVRASRRVNMWRIYIIVLCSCFNSNCVSFDFKVCPNFDRSKPICSRAQGSRRTNGTIRMRATKTHRCWTISSRCTIHCGSRSARSCSRAPILRPSKHPCQPNPQAHKIVLLHCLQVDPTPKFKIRSRSYTPSTL